MGREKLFLSHDLGHDLRALLRKYAIGIPLKVITSKVCPIGIPWKNKKKFSQITQKKLKKLDQLMCAPKGAHMSWSSKKRNPWEFFSKKKKK